MLFTQVCRSPPHCTGGRCKNSEKNKFKKNLNVLHQNFFLLKSGLFCGLNQRNWHSFWKEILLLYLFKCNFHWQPFFFFFLMNEPFPFKTSRPRQEQKWLEKIVKVSCFLFETDFKKKKKKISPSIVPHDLCSHLHSQNSLWLSKAPSKLCSTICLTCFQKSGIVLAAQDTQSKCHTHRCVPSGHSHTGGACL